ncbi:hypothetical protein TRFO_08002 [Tritrichomonas foetus]|uniref:Translation initiation factor eIF2B subunit epsilon n=1 Tax=Tritrichomonas foetus TaxID=1144522 RepID=A0A1J4JS29_9EUKA|nr:hypothetical protein TRFO_08002 [Tritrichomonas foetus]|eukprot:OHT00334.1 hypothetical protein TRFO_08002 [Tritrichomonas foetus]
MSGKRGGQAKKKNNTQPKFQEQESGTVAFVLCHPLNSSLSPITSELPPCLFPLCNTPVLLYVLNWLNINGIERIYIVCHESHFKPIEKCVKQCSERMLMESIEILPASGSIYSTGDAIRWIYSWNHVDHRFKHCVIVPGTLVTNVPLKTVVSEHENRCEKAKRNELEPILTTIFTQARSNGYSAILNNEGRLLHLHIPPEINFGSSNPSLKVDPSIFKTQKSVTVKTGLNDSQIYIGSLQLLANFSSTDAFEWHSVTHDAIPSLIWNVELHSQSIHACIIPDAFASHVSDLPEYLHSSLALIRRWLYPVTLEMNLFKPEETYTLLYADDDDESFNDSPDAESTKNNNQSKNTNFEVTNYRLERDLIYLYDNVFPSLSAKIGHSVVVGSNTEIGDNAVISNASIGSNCKIGKNVFIKDCVIWDRVVIEDGARIENSIIASDVTISEGVKIEFGCILSFNVVVDLDLPPCRRLTGYIADEDESMNGTFRSETAPEWLKKYVDEKEPLNIEDDANSFEFVPNPEHEFPLLRLWYEISPDTFPIDPSEIDYETIGKENEEENKTRETSTDENDDFIQLDAHFQEEAADVLSSLIESDLDSDQIRSEFVSLKNSEYAEHIDCAVAIMLAINEHWELSSISHGFDLLGEMLASFMSDVDTQEDFLFWFQSFCAKQQQGVPLFNQGLKILIDRGVVSEDALDKWGDEQYDCTPAQARLFEQYKNW